MNAVLTTPSAGNKVKIFEMGLNHYRNSSVALKYGNALEFSDSIGL